MTSEERGSLGEKIHDLRNDRSMSLADLERMSGVTKGYLSQLERGKKKPSLETIEKVARGLGVPLAELLGEPERQEETMVLPEGLRAFLAHSKEEGNPLSEEDVRMLVGIRYRGKQPRTASDWALVYYFIKGIVR